MNGFTLKLIAIITMLIDHTAAVLIPYDSPAYMICRSIGRLAFPIFCFLLVEGLLHTKNVQKYLIRLGIFALISEIPFDLAFNDKWMYLNYQNIFFTLFIGLAVIYCMNRIEKKYETNILKANLVSCLIIMMGCFIANFLKTDYSYLGILLIVVFYLFHQHKVILIFAVFVVTFVLGNPLEALATLSMIFISFYNGKRGPHFNKYIFYAFYPVHILCIYLISLLPMFQ